MVVVVLVLVFSNDFLANELLRWWEPEPVPVNTLPEHELAIVLGGFINTELTPRDRVYTHSGADRLLHAVFLYKQGKVKKILVSGGNAKMFIDIPKEALAARELLLTLGVPAQDILVETASRNTYENAVFTKDMLAELYPQGVKCVLLTSAFHMRRSAGCFKNAGIEFTAFATDFRTAPRSFSPDPLLIPKEDAWGKWRLLFKEWLGYTSYRVAGYI